MNPRPGFQVLGTGATSLHTQAGAGQKAAVAELRRGARSRRPPDRPGHTSFAGSQLRLHPLKCAGDNREFLFVITPPHTQTLYWGEN